MRNINSTQLTKQSILDKVSQVTIFATYLGLPAETIQYCIETGELICNPLRIDCHPTAGFRYNNKGKLKFKDFGNDYFWGDCFDIVALVMGNIYGKKYNVADKEDFVKVLRHITFTFKDIFYGLGKDIGLINEINAAIGNIRHQKPVIELVVRDWNMEDEKYWGKFKVPLHVLNLNFVYPVEQYYVNRNINPEPKYYYDYRDPCYGYVLGRDRDGIYNIKLYFPNRDKNHVRFITNCNHLEGVYNLDRDDYDFIVVTKSTKDRLSIKAAISRVQSLYGVGRGITVGVVNIPHETYHLRQSEYDWMSGKLAENGKIVSLMDNDRTGIREAVWLKVNYKIIPLMIPYGLHAKDFAELVSVRGDSEICDFIAAAIDYSKDYKRDETEERNIVWDTEKGDDLPY